jgi:hypothetical protein
MSLTVNTVPARIDSAATFNVTTSLVEDSTHVNLRVRADIYFEGVIKATIELPKGLADFDLSRILKPLVPGIKLARNSAAYYSCGSIGSNLITLITTKSGSWDTLTITDNTIDSAIEASSATVYAETNNIAMTVGKIYVLFSNDYGTSGVNAPVFGLTGDMVEETMVINKGILIMPKTSGNKRIYVGGAAGQLNFSCTLECYEITSSKTTVGSPLAIYSVVFTEVYETAAGVTTLGTPVPTKIYRYVPASVTFTEYNMHDNACLFANLTLRNNATKFFSSVHREYFLVFFTEYYGLELFYQRDSAGWVHTQHPNCYEGWGVIYMNMGELFSGVVSFVSVYLKEVSAPTTISETLVCYLDTTQNNDRVILEFTGSTGGKEYLSFEGKTDINYETVRDYYKAVSGARKPLELTGFSTHKMETLYKDMANTAYLKALLIATDVKKLNASYVDVEATVITKEVKINEGRALFTNAIEIEYEE